MLNTMCADIRRRIAELRSIERIISAETFSITFAQSKEIDKQNLHFALNIADIDAVKVILKNMEESELSIRELREKAKRLTIRGWSRMDRDMLNTVIALKETQNAQP